MSTISATTVRDLRERTGCGMMDCKRALEEAGGDLEKAIAILRKRGLADASKRSGRSTDEGLIASYIHTGGKIGVLIEINCETDFVARNDVFQELARDLCMQIAAADPIALRREDVPDDIVEKEKTLLLEQAADKPENVREKIVTGRLGKFFKERVLMEQPFVKEPKISVEELLNSAISKTGENIVVRRFARYQLGQ